MPRFIAAENDTRALPPPSASSATRVTVVVPVYNRVALLERTIAGLAVQDHPAELLEVVVADDGSTEDVAAALAPWHEHLDLTVLRRDHEGYGAGQARNLGAGAASGDVVLFVDADCLPARSLVRRHAAWHDLADNLVVVGARHDLDTTGIDAEAVLRGSVVVEEGDGTPPGDWRELFYRRTARLHHGDEAYRAVVSNNLSVRRDVFEEVGGFCEDFVRWGGEDTELGWRLFRAGCFVVADDHAVVHHQVQEDGDEGWRQAQRARNEGLVRTRIPHRFYRRRDDDVLFEVPRASWVLLPTELDHVPRLWDELLDHTFGDWELVVADPDDELSPFTDLRRADPRLTVVRDRDPLAAVRAARGEVLLLLHGAASPDRAAAARIVRRLDQRPRTQVVTVGAAEPTPDGEGTVVWRHAADVARRGGELGLPWPPLTAVRGREVAKVLPEVDDLAGLWQALRPITTPDHLGQPLVALPGADGQQARRHPPRLPSRRRVVVDALAGDLAPVRAARLLVREQAARSRAAPEGPAVVPPAGAGAAGAREEDTQRTAVTARYVGWTGQANLGDDAMLAAARQLLPWADVTTKGGEPGDLLVLGGGTLVNRGYLKVLRELDSPRSERVVLGTGVGAPSFWGVRASEPAEDWATWVATCGYVGVRGPDSVDRLRRFGVDGPVEVVGDLALALPAPAGVERVAGRLVVAPLHTGGRCHGGDDRVVLDALAGAVAAAVADGREVHLLACHPTDDRWCHDVMRAAGHPDLPHHAGYDDVDAALALLASADAVVAERLHAGVLAAVVGTPFVPVEYRPKTRDFARSVGAEDVLLRTDAIDHATLTSTLAHLERTRDEHVERVAEHVATYRRRLRAAATTIEGLVR